MEFNMEEYEASLDVMINRLQEEKRIKQVKEHNAKAMRDALGVADV